MDFLATFFSTTDPTFIWLGVFAVVFAGYMAWMIGSNDVANAMATSVGSGALSYRKAVIIAALADFLGATLAGGAVTDTVRKGIVNTEVFVNDPNLLIIGMISAMLAAGLWLHLATSFGLPVSTTHSIVGAIVGFGFLLYGSEAVQWGKVGAIVASWIVSPVGGGLLGFLVFLFVRQTILNAETPQKAIRIYGPVLGAVTIWMIVLSGIWKGLKNLNIILGPGQLVLLSIVAGIAGYIILFFLVRRIAPDDNTDMKRIERIFVILQVITATYVAFAHGANDVANAIGPLAAVLNTIREGFVSTTKVPVPLWVLAYGGAGIAIGLAVNGARVMRTVGQKITEITPSRGFSAEFAAATVVTLFSKLGMPVSTTHCLVGAVMGVGVAQGIDAINLKVIRSIAFSWILTLPVAGVTCMLIFLAIRAMLGI